MVFLAALLVVTCMGAGLSGCTGTGPDPEVLRFFCATWRAGAGTQSSAVYGNASGVEYLLELVLSEDGTAELTPLEGHEDLPGATGTWAADDTSSVTLSFPDQDVELTVIDDVTLEGPAAAFGITGFDTVEFTYY